VADNVVGGQKEFRNWLSSCRPLQHAEDYLGSASGHWNRLILQEEIMRMIKYSKAMGP
jgi:hypothetical protein